jgi:hypothetical protein
MCSSTQLNRPIWSKQSHLLLETPLLQEGFLSKLTLFSQGNNVLDAPASTTNGDLLRDMFVSSTYQNRPIWKKMRLSHLEISDLKEVFFQKLTQFSLGKNVLDAPPCNTGASLLRDTCVSSS